MHKYYQSTLGITPIQNIYHMWGRPSGSRVYR